MPARCRKTAHPDGELADGDRVAQGMHAKRTTRTARLAHRRICGYVNENMVCIFKYLYLNNDNK
jgi:hypothetical protein